jgi:hypothetical protein
MDETLTLEGIDVETLVVPVEIFGLKCVFKFTSLCIIRGDDAVTFSFVLEVPCEKHDCFNFFLVLEDGTKIWSASLIRSITSAALTNELFPSSSNCSEPFTSTKRQAMSLEGTT